MTTEFVLGYRDQPFQVDASRFLVWELLPSSFCVITEVFNQSMDFQYAYKSELDLHAYIL